ncbi:MAG TPA: ElyC/SanA/YdcF family protein [bacterium]|nr:ElyC/SanA/YdcF family protein [bacterium]
MAAGLALGAAALLGPLLYFQAMLRSLPAPPAQCDLFAVFGGVPERVGRGFHIAAGMDAQAFVVSDSSAEVVAGYLRSYGAPGKAKVLLEPDARHTTQNAWNVVRLAQAGGYRRVVIATSWYHLPRALLLMRLAAAGTSLTLLPVATEPVPLRWWAEPYFWMEVPKFWGSLAQVALGSVLPRGLGGRA